MKGRFITIEGQDGAGKTTNLEFIRNYLEARCQKVHTTREPGGTPLGETLRNILLYDADTNCNDMAELLMMFAARAQHLEEVIYPLLESGTWVVSDRFTDATFAYQGAGRGISMDKIRVLEKLVQDKFIPDLTVLLDLPLEAAKNRGATDQGDRFESQHDPFKQRVRNYYLSLHTDYPDRVKLVNAAQPLEHVQASIVAFLDPLIKDVNKTCTDQS